MCIHIYIYIHRERDVYIYIYIYIPSPKHPPLLQLNTSRPREISNCIPVLHTFRLIFQRACPSPPKSILYSLRYRYLLTHGWSRHGSSRIPSKHSIPQDLYNPCLNSMNYARTMLTSTMCSRRRTRLLLNIKGCC